MKASERCLKLIKDCEGFRSKPYLCPAGKATIGFGSTRYLRGVPVTLQDPPIDEVQATQLLADTLVEYEEAVDKLVTVDLTQGQFDSLVDFSYNCGIGNLKTSTLLKLVNLGQPKYAAQEFEKWVHANGKVLAGLVKRRALEAALFKGQLA
jgi:lysozyme